MMKTSAERLKWFLDFAQLEWVSNLDEEAFLFETPESIPELKELKEWEFLKLKEEVIEFIGGDDANEPFRFGIKKEPVAYDKNLFPIWGRRRILSDAIGEFLTREELAGLCVRAGGYLDTYIREERVTEVSSESETISFGDPTVSFNMRTATWFIESSSPAHLFFIRFGLVLMQEGTSEIQKCPECRRAFYRVRKQKYCSKTCINRVSRRKWLEDPKNKKKDRQWAQERYKRRVQEKTSAKVRVKSRKTRKKGEDI
jgi:hypothetical protein